MTQTLLQYIRGLFATYLAASAAPPPNPTGNDLVMYNIGGQAYLKNSAGVVTPIGSGGPGGGANQALSNLTDPTAINQNLIFAFMDEDREIKTADNAAGSDDIELRTGDSSAGRAGSTTMAPGLSTVGNGGASNVRGGDTADASALGGTARLQAGRNTVTNEDGNAEILGQRSIFKRGFNAAGDLVAQISQWEGYDPVNNEIKTIGFRASFEMTDDLLFTWPKTQGMAGQVLKVDGDGDLYWADESGGGGSFDPSDIQTELVFTGATGTIRTQDAAAGEAAPLNFVTGMSQAGFIGADAYMYAGNSPDAAGGNLNLYAGYNMADGVFGNIPLRSSAVEIRGNPGVHTSRVRFYNLAQNRHISFRAPNVMGPVNFDYVLPASDGSPGFVLTTDGNGNLSWTEVSGGGGAFDPENIMTQLLFATGVEGYIAPRENPNPGEDGRTMQVFGGRATGGGQGGNTLISGGNSDTGPGGQLGLRGGQNELTGELAAVVIQSDTIFQSPLQRYSGGAQFTSNDNGAGQAGGFSFKPGVSGAGFSGAHLEHYAGDSEDQLGGHVEIYAGRNLATGLRNYVEFLGDYIEILRTGDGLGGLKSSPLHFQSINAAETMIFRASIKSAQNMEVDVPITLPVTPGLVGQTLKEVGGGQLAYEDAVYAFAEPFTLDAGQIAAQKVTLANVPQGNVAILFFEKLGQRIGVDFSVDGAEVRFGTAADPALVNSDLDPVDGATPLAEGDTIYVHYISLTNAPI